MTRVAVLQSNYIPWKGYFDIIHDVDLFLFYDDRQYTKNDWRNRNRIKTPGGPAWLTIPVGKRESRLICDVPLPGRDWARAHWQRLQEVYGAAPYFDEYRAYFERVYLGTEWRGLSELNQALITGIARDLLGLSTAFGDSRDYRLTGAKGERVLELVEQAGGRVYVSGPSARAYLPVEAFAARGIDVVWKDYAGYPAYPQLHPPFAHEVTVLDVLFHTGPAAPWHIWGWRTPHAGAAA